MDTFIVKVPAVGDPTVEPFNSKDSYKQLSDAVGGYLELAPIPRRIVTQGKYTVDCFVDEEGLLKTPPLPTNLRLCRLTGHTIVGNGVFAAHDNVGETVGLSKDDAAEIMLALRRCAPTPNGRH